MQESLAEGGWTSRSPCALRHCLAERLRTQRLRTPETWRMAGSKITVVTAAYHDRLHWPWLRDRRISNWCNLILKRRLRDWHHITITELERFLNSIISQSSVATHLRCGGIFNDSFIARQTIKQEQFNFWRPCTKYLSKTTVRYKVYNDLYCLLLIGHASKPHISTGRHLTFNSFTVTSSEAAIATFPNTAIKAR